MRPVAGADLRMTLVGAAAWVGGLLGALAPAPVLGGVAGATLAACAVLAAWGRRAAALTGAVLLVVLQAVGVSSLLRHDQVARGPVAELAAERAVVRVVATVTGDPRPLDGPYADGVVLRVSVREIGGRGRVHALRAPVLVLAPDTWREVPLGASVVASGRLGVAEGDDVAAVLHASGAPRVRAPPDLWWRGAGAVRASLRDSVAHRPAPERVLVPALVDGDDVGLAEEVADDFRTTGLTHLLAVSGTNLTLVVGSLLWLARGCRVRGRWLLLVGAAGIVGFVLLARTEPSVLRAAVMGAVALVALGTDGARRGPRTLGVAVTALLLVQPALAVSIGFALSVLATAGIMLLAPGWRDAMTRWMPRWLAEAIAVPAAAQLACTPLVAGISGQVSLVAVGANLLAAPVVGPATVIGLAGGIVGLVAPPVGRLLGTVATWCLSWIVAVAERGAALPAAAVDWDTGPLSLTLLTVLSLGLAALAPRLLVRPFPTVLACLALGVVVVVRPPSATWAPEGWVLVVCDVGQGDALVLRAGEGSAVVVDAGPDPEAVDRCLDDLGVQHVALLVLTHFHADHVDGVARVFDGRSVDRVLTSPLLDPPEAVATVGRTAREAGAAVGVAPYAVALRIGDVVLQPVWPTSSLPAAGPGDGSTANDQSVVLLAEVGGVRVLLPGDLEPPGQAALVRALPDLRVDVLKVPHHGSRAQDLDLLTGLDAEVAVVPVGADNTYGHPDPGLLAALEGSGADVLRTDTDGALAVVVRDGVAVGVSRR
ncbi:ComEC family competence protein [Nocardioides dokdonensis FR1436]|uniref:ComEC family competence protein n=1 Tax=Nocardioides dokdonensis FR1436 TaxID=1300347 RepID=A0A1A9GPL5_9ACTN|nr:ComEC/Rec2 family competence protein [Nocardioides dokdonensis]ANH40228.1 ComEC family competence protein [Nocardioides dokdonensis FR1436]